MQDISIHIHFVKAVLKHAILGGHDTEQLLRTSGISPRLLQEQQARVSAEQFARLQSLTMRAMEDELLGYGDQPFVLGQWSALCHWLIRCKTLGQALKRFCIFYQAMGKTLQPGLLETDEEFSIEIHPVGTGSPRLEPYTYELFTFALHRQLCWLANANLPLRHVYLPFDEPSHSREYRPLYVGAPMTFNADCCRLVFQKSLLEKPVKQTTESLEDFLRKPLYNILVGGYSTKSWSQRIKDAIGSDFSEFPTFAEIAHQLEMNPKKLRRLLGDEGLAYRDLKTQLRRDLAIYLLSDHQTPVEDIAFKTGFSEASAFIRAFKGWTGVTPLTYRKDLS